MTTTTPTNDLLQLSHTLILKKPKTAGLPLFEKHPVLVEVVHAHMAGLIQAMMYGIAMTHFNIEWENDEYSPDPDADQSRMPGRVRLMDYGASDIPNTDMAVPIMMVAQSAAELVHRLYHQGHINGLEPIPASMQQYMLNKLSHIYWDATNASTVATLYRWRAEANGTMHVVLTKRLAIMIAELGAEMPPNPQDSLTYTLDGDNNDYDHPQYQEYAEAAVQGALILAQHIANSLRAAGYDTVAQQQALPRINIILVPVVDTDTMFVLQEGSGNTSPDMAVITEIVTDAIHQLASDPTLAPDEILPEVDVNIQVDIDNVELDDEDD